MVSAQIQILLLYAFLIIIFAAIVLAGTSKSITMSVRVVSSSGRALLEQNTSAPLYENESVGRVYLSNHSLQMNFQQEFVRGIEKNQCVYLSGVQAMQ